jgi:hypothetical protein
MNKHNAIRAAVNVFFAFIAIPVLFLAYWKGQDLYYKFSKTDAYVEKLCTPALTKRLMCFCFAEYGRECPLERANLSAEMLSEKE